MYVCVFFFNVPQSRRKKVATNWSFFLLRREGERTRKKVATNWKKVELERYCAASSSYFR